MLSLYMLILYLISTDKTNMNSKFKITTLVDKDWLKNGN